MDKKTVAIIVAHPDDETLWAAGTILEHPEWQCFIITLCRKNDPDRAPKFAKVLKILGAEGSMGDLDDGPDQLPQSDEEVDDMVLGSLPVRNFDLIITHSVNGEYTRHLRHEEVGKAVIRLWQANKLSTVELWAFAFEDGHRAYTPRAIKNASIYHTLSQALWNIKYDIITTTYGFEKSSWEARTTPKEEAFWQFSNAADAQNGLIAEK